MKKTFVALCVLFLGAFGGCSSQDYAGPLAIDFVHDYSTGIAMAKDQGKPIMLIFTADWCGACTDLKKTVFTNKNVGEASRKLVNIAVDVDKDNESPRQYKVRYIPAIYFLDPSGTQTMPYQGPRTPEHFVKIMNAFADKYAS